MTGRADASGEPTREDRGNLGGTEYKNEEELDMVARKDPAIARAVATAKELSRSERMQYIAEQSEKQRRDQADLLLEARENAVAEGLAKGLAKGFAQGRAEGRTEGHAEGIRLTAIEAIKAGAEDAFVSRIAGIPLSEVIELRKSIER